jgi:hypothetical protein
VTVKGSARPITLYTLDIAEDEANMRAAERLDPSLGSTAEDEAQALEKFKVVRALAEDRPTPVAVGHDPELEEAEREALDEMEREVRTFRCTAAVFELRRSTAVPGFMQTWDQALRLYMHGSWAEAHQLFAKCKALVPDDGPTETLMDYLERRNCVAPKGWHGACAIQPPRARARAAAPPRALTLTALRALPAIAILVRAAIAAGVRELTSK